MNWNVQFTHLLCFIYTDTKYIIWRVSNESQYLFNSIQSLNECFQIKTTIPFTRFFLFFYYKILIVWHYLVLVRKANSGDVYVTVQCCKLRKWQASFHSKRASLVLIACAIITHKPLIVLIIKDREWQTGSLSFIYMSLYTNIWQFRSDRECLS